MGLEDDIDFNQLREDAKHDELKSALNKILMAISEDNSDTLISDAINKNTEAIRQFVDAIQNYKPIAQAPNATINNDSVAQSISDMAKQINDNLVNIKNITPQQVDDSGDSKEWTFKVSRNSYGYIDNIIAKSN